MEKDKEKLENFDIEVWQDQGGGIKAGDKWRDQIESGIKSSNVVLILLTPSSCASSYVTFEWAFGLGLGKRLIPLLWKDCEKHPRLETIQHIDFRSRPRKWDLLKAEELLKTVETHTDSDIEGVWGDTFMFKGDPHVALINIRKMQDKYFIKGYEYDSKLNIRQFWESDFSHYDKERRNLEYLYRAKVTEADGFNEVQGFTEIAFSGTSGDSPTTYKGTFKDFGRVRAAIISGRRVAESYLFDDEKGKKELAQKLLDDM